MKTKEQLSAPKIITILVEFGRKMEAILVEMRKLVPRPQPEPIRLPIPSPKDMPHKTRLIVELKTPLPQRLGKEPIAEAVKKATPTIMVLAKPKMTKKESETPKITSFDPSPQRSSKKKKKEPSLKPSTETEEEGSSEELEELELASSKEKPDSKEEEAEPAIPAPEKKKIRP